MEIPWQKMPFFHFSNYETEEQRIELPWKETDRMFEYYFIRAVVV